MFPVVAIDDVSHASFMDSTKIPSFVSKSDLKPEVDETTAHSQIGATMTAFIKNTLGDQDLYADSILDLKKYETEELLKPFLDMMT
jgi:hypothetical protein